MDFEETKTNNDESVSEQMYPIEKMDVDEAVIDNEDGTTPMDVDDFVKCIYIYLFDKGLTLSNNSDY